MKKLALLLLTVFPALCSIECQPINLSINRGHFTLGQTIIRGAGDSWLVGGAAGDFFGYPMYRPYLAAFEADGGLLWEQYLADITGLELGVVTTLAYDPELQVYYASGFASGCDYGLPGFLYQFDTEGNLNWFREINDYSGYSSIGMLPGRGVLLGSEYAGPVLWLNSQGDEVLSMDIIDSETGPVTAITAVDSSRAYVLAQNKLFFLHIEEEWSVQAELGIPGAQGMALLGDDGELAVLSGGRLRKVDTSLAILDELIIGNIANFYELDCYGDQCVAIGKSGSGEYRAQSFNLAGDIQLLSNIRFENPYYLPYGLALREWHFVLIGSAVPDVPEVLPRFGSEFYAHRGSDLFLKSYPIDDVPVNNGMHVALGQINVDNFTANTEPGFCSEIGMNIQASGIKVKITNNSTVPLGSVRLNAALRPCSFICSTIQAFGRNYTLLDLPPSESRMVDFPNINSAMMPYQSSFALCIWASGPNGRLDDNFEDNESCISFVINDTEEPVSPFGRFQLSPNPARERLNLDFGQPLPAGTTLTIFNSLGQPLLHRKEEQPDNQLSLDISQLPAGAYFLFIRNGKERLSRRFVVASR